ncbi:MAG: TonB-dependent receptor, partial [Burkholderiales bacterium]
MQKKLFYANNKKSFYRFTAAVVIAHVLPSSAQAEDDAPNKASVLEVPKIEVIGTTPLPGIGVPLEKFPANVQNISAEKIGKQKALGIADFIDQNSGSVTAGAGQNNPFQPDISFRGFAASPLLGTPMGLSVYMDGVRINESFGDVVNWDLIPQSAISSVQLIPGSNPVFGLNTLGGALSINTKSGLHYPGYRAQAYAGLFGRRAFEFDAGGRDDKLDYFVTGNIFSERGWREHSTSSVKQLFGKFGYEDDDTDFDLSFNFADNTLEGVQALPVSMLNNPRQAYTYPDRTNNKLATVNLKASDFIGGNEEHLIAGNIYLRKLKSDTFSSNLNADYDGSPYDGTPNSIQAFNDTHVVDQTGYGAALQYTSLAPIGNYQNQLVVGASADVGRADFTQSNQPAIFTADRGTSATVPFRIDTLAKTRNDYFGLLFTDSLSIDKQWTLTLSGRYNQAKVKIEDVSGTNSALNGNHTFHRFNPAVGMNYSPSSALTAYASYNEGMRAPSPVELTCADPAAPCKLPNNFLADPPLKPVISKTIETGARGKLGNGAQWNLAIFRTDLSDDIQFISSGGAINAGYFQNVGTTRRQGMEWGIADKFGALDLTVRYSFIRATYESAFTAHSPNNSSADANGDVAVQPGNKLTGIPQQAFKFRAEYNWDENFSMGANWIAVSSQYPRGNENNLDANGKIPGYGVINFDARYQANKELNLFIKINNLLNNKYYTFGVLGENFFTGPGNTYDLANTRPELFVSSAAPLGAWFGVEYKFGGTS